MSSYESLKVLSFPFSMDTACVEVKLSNGVIAHFISYRNI